MMNKANFQDLTKRLISSSLSIMCVIILLTFAMEISVKVILSILLSFIAGVGMWEYIQLIEQHPRKWFRVILIGFSAGLVCTVYLSLTFSGFIVLPWVWLFLGTAVLFFYHFNKIQGALTAIATGLLGVCYIALPICLLLSILYLDKGNFQYQDGRLWIAYLVIVTKVTDIAGYFGGKLWGKKKLAPVLSPHKTITGAVCGFFGAILFSVLFYFVMESFSVVKFRLQLFESLWLGALIGLFSQLGDLAESLLKRDKGIKDSNQIPGIGGVLDLFDSLLFTIPIVFLFLLVHR